MIEHLIFPFLEPHHCSAQHTSFEHAAETERIRRGEPVSGPVPHPAETGRGGQRRDGFGRRVRGEGGADAGRQWERCWQWWWCIGDGKWWSQRGGEYLLRTIQSSYHLAAKRPDDQVESSGSFHSTGWCVSWPCRADGIVQEVKRKGAQLAKFALAMEYKRVIIRRDMIVRTSTSAVFQLTSNPSSSSQLLRLPPASRFAGTEAGSCAGLC
jgi:hypothetical protein